MNILDLLLKIGVLEQVVFREIVKRPRRFLEDRELGFILIALAVDKSDPLLNISDEQMSYVTNADAGCGLIRYGSALVPFINRFPRDTRLYALMTTKPGEGVFGGEEVPA